MTAIVQVSSGFLDYTGAVFSSQAVSMPGNWTAGNMLAVFVSWRDVTFDGNINASVSDAAGNTYVAQTKTQTATFGGGDQWCQWFLAKNLSGTPAAGVTVVWSSIGATLITARVIEISGQDTATQPDAAVVGLAQNNVSNSADAITSGNVTTVTNGCLVVGATVEYFQGQAALFAGTGYTGLTSLSNGANAIQAIAYRTQSTAGAIAGTFTSTDPNDSYTTQVLAIRPAAATGAKPSSTNRRRRAA